MSPLRAKSSKAAASRHPLAFELGLQLPFANHSPLSSKPRKHKMHFRISRPSYFPVSLSNFVDSLTVQACSQPATPSRNKPSSLRCLFCLIVCLFCPFPLFPSFFLSPVPLPCLFVCRARVVCVVSVLGVRCVRALRLLPFSSLASSNAPAT